MAFDWFGFVRRKCVYNTLFSLLSIFSWLAAKKHAQLIFYEWIHFVLFHSFMKSYELGLFDEMKNLARHFNDGKFTSIDLK